jgi:hypothetical protein
MYLPDFPLTSSDLAELISLISLPIALSLLAEVVLLVSEESFGERGDIDKQSQVFSLSTPFPTSANDTVLWIDHAELCLPAEDINPRFAKQE